jgi:peptidyl-prolyl cis-trans isomerase C
MKADHDAAESEAAVKASPEQAEAAAGKPEGATEQPAEQAGAEGSAADSAKGAAADSPKGSSAARSAEGAAEDLAEKPEEPARSGRHALPDGDEPGGVGAMPPPATVPPARGGGWWPPRSGQAKALVAAVLVLLIGLGGVGYWWFAVRLPGGVAFRVNGVEVTESSLDEQVHTLGALYGVQPPPAQEPARLDKFRRDVAKSTAIAMVIDDAATERKIVIEDRLASDYLGRYVAQYFGAGPQGRDAFLKDLASKGTSEPKVIAELKRQMLLKELFTQVTSPITISDQDVRTAFDQRQAEFGTPERREIHNIAVTSKQDADAALGEVNVPGASFEAVATRRTLDTTTRANGGSLGEVAARDLDPAYAGPAFAAPVGAVFGPVETHKQGPSGPTSVFNIGKVVQVQPAVPAEFERVKDTVKQTLFRERADGQWRSFLGERIRAADVSYADAYQPADPDSLPPTGGSGTAPARSEPPR